MRTVTFSSAKVAEVVNAKFLPVWYNRGEGFHNCSPMAEKNIFENSSEAYPTKNICTFFLTPELKVVHYMAGYTAPELFLEVLSRVEKLQAASSDFGKLHREFSLEMDDRLKPQTRASKLPYEEFKYRDQEHRHGKQCWTTLEKAFSYFKTVHDTLARDGIVPFEKVQHAYLFGNSFSEEGDPSRKEIFPRPQKTPSRPSTPTGG